MSETNVRPFSNGTEGLDWRSANCERCVKIGHPDEMGEGPCPMETAVARGFILGTIPADLAVEYGASIREQPGFCTMPRQCSQFEPQPSCEWISWPGTRRRQVCGRAMSATVDVKGHTRAVCPKHQARYEAIKSVEGEP